MPAEDAGTISAQIRLELTQLEKDALAAQGKMDQLSNKFKQQGQTAGTVYVQGFGKAQQRLNMQLNNMVNSLQSVSPRMGALGVKMATAFSAPLFSMVPAVSMAFSTMMGPIGMIIGAVQSLWGVVTKAFDHFNAKNKEAAERAKQVKEEVKKIKEELVDMQKETASTMRGIDIRTELGMTTELEKARQKANELDRTLNKLIDRKAELDSKKRTSEENDLLKDIDKKIKANSDALNYYKFYTLTFKEAQGELRGEINKTNSLIERQNDIYKNIKNAKEEAINSGDYSAALKIQSDYVASLEAEETALVNIIKKNKAILDARKNGSNVAEGGNEASVKAKTELANAEKKLNELRKAVIDAYSFTSLNEEKAELKRIEAFTKEKTEINDIKKAREDALEKFAQAEKKANDDKEAHLINELEATKQIESSRAQLYSDLENITVQYRNATGAAQKELQITKEKRDETAELVKLNQDSKWLADTQASQYQELTKQAIEELRAKAEGAKTEKEKNGYLQEALDLENSLIVKQREIERQALENTESFKAQSEEVRDKILADFDKITDKMQKANNSGKKKGKNWLANVLGVDEEDFEYSMDCANGTIDAISSISDSILEISRRTMEEQITNIEKTLEVTLENIEKERKARLIANGFAVENNAESLEQQLEDAIRTGDEVLIYQTQRKLEEQRINDEFDAQAKAAQEEAAKQKAQLEYEMAKQEYAVQMVNAVNAGIMAVLMALSSCPPPYNFILAGLSGAATAVSIGLLAANPPKPPTFESGGIVPGSSYSGDNVVARVNSGELILNRSQQDNIAEQLTGNGTVSATVVIMLDAKEIGRETFDLANKGHYTLKTRVIQG